MSEFTDDQYRVVLKAIQENKFLSGNYKIYKFASMEVFEALIDELFESGAIDHKNSPVKPKNSSIEFYDKEYKITQYGLNWLREHK